MIEGFVAALVAAVVVAFTWFIYDFNVTTRHEEAETERTRLEACGTIDSTELRVLCINRDGD